MTTPSLVLADVFSATGAGAPAEATVSFNPGTDADTLIVGLVRTFNRTLSSATWDGSAATLGTTFGDHNGYNERPFYIHIGTGAGSKNLVLQMSATGTVQLILSAWKDVDPSGFAAALDLTNGTQTFDANPTWTVDSAAGDLVAVLLTHDRANTPGVEAPATEVFTDSANDGTYWLVGYIWQEAGAASVTINGTIGGNGWGGAAFNLKAASGGASAEGGGMLLGSRRNRLTIP